MLFLQYRKKKASISNDGHMRGVVDQRMDLLEKISEHLSCAIKVRFVSGELSQIRRCLSENNKYRTRHHH